MYLYHIYKFHADQAKMNAPERAQAFGTQMPWPYLATDSYETYNAIVPTTSVCHILCGAGLQYSIPKRAKFNVTLPLLILIYKHVQ